MNDCDLVSQQYEEFKKNIENRSSELMIHLEQSRNTFYENLAACKEYVIEQINCLFNELESQTQADQKETDTAAEHIGSEILDQLEKLEGCVAHISACKQSLKNLLQSQNA